MFFNATRTAKSENAFRLLKSWEINQQKLIYYRHQTFARQDDRWRDVAKEILCNEYRPTTSSLPARQCRKLPATLSQLDSTYLMAERYFRCCALWIKQVDCRMPYWKAAELKMVFGFTVIVSSSRWIISARHGPGKLSFDGYDGDSMPPLLQEDLSWKITFAVGLIRFNRNILFWLESFLVVAIFCSYNLNQIPIYRKKVCSNSIIDWQKIWTMFKHLKININRYV